MSMEITNNYSDYGKGYTNTAKEGNVTTSTVELKTWLSKFNNAKLLDNDMEPLNLFSNRRGLTDEEVEQTDNQKSESKTDIIVKADGSRVLVMTMSIGGMETTMSLEISKPTNAPNENTKQNIDNKMYSDDAEIEQDFFVMSSTLLRRVL